MFRNRVVLAELVDGCGNCGPNAENDCGWPELELTVVQDGAFRRYRIEPDREGRYRLTEDGRRLIVDIDYPTAQMMTRVYSRDLFEREILEA